MINETKRDVFIKRIDKRKFSSEKLVGIKNFSLGKLVGIENFS